MYFDGEYKLIGSADPQPLATALAGMTEEAWYVDAARQHVFPAHATTQSMHLIFDADYRHEAPTTLERYAAFETLVKPVMTQIATYFDANMPERTGPTAQMAPYFVRIIIVRLKGNTFIAPHYDNGYSLIRSHRIHFPIITNPRNIFSVGGIERHLKAGEIWEINNRKLHAVRNEGEDRVHVILDYVIPGEVINTPTGQAIA